MTTFTLCTSIVFFALTALADPPRSQITIMPIKNAPATQGGMWQAQHNLRNQNFASGDQNSDEKFQIRQLQKNSDTATANVTASQKTQQYNLGAEILPFVASYINEIANECIKKIDLDSASAENKVAECTKLAVAQFQANPTAFLARLPSAEKQRLEFLVQQRIGESLKPRKPPMYMEP